MAHCVPSRWRNFSHYCRPLRHYDVFWAQRSTDLRADSRRYTHTSDWSARVKYIVRHWASREASLRHSSGWGTEAFPLSSVICAPVHYTILYYYIVLYYVTLRQVALRRVTSRWSKNLMELIFTCGEFLWIPEDPVSQFHSSYLLVGAPGIFSDLTRTVHMLKRERQRERERETCEKQWEATAPLHPW